MKPRPLRIKHNRSILSIGLSALVGLMIIVMLPGAVSGQKLDAIHLKYQINVSKGLLGRGDITGHLQVDYGASRYSITIWAEAITKKVLFIPIGRATEDEAMDLVLDPEHINPLRVYCTAYGRLVDGEMRADGVVVTDKVDGRVISRLDIRDTAEGGAVATYTFMDNEPITKHFSRRPSEPLTALIAIAGGREAIYTVSLSSSEGPPALTGRMLSASDNVDAYTLLKTGPDTDGRFWDFKSNAYARFEDSRISHLRIDRYNVFKSIKVRCKGTLPLKELGAGDALVASR